MTEPSPQPASSLRCCFCGGDIPTGPEAANDVDPARLVFVDLAPGEGAQAFGAREQELQCHLDCFQSRLHAPELLEPFRPIPEDALEKAILDACDELAHSLFVEHVHLPFRDRLFASPPGRWIPVAELCAGLPFAELRLAEIAERSRGDVTLFVQHTPDPIDPNDEYALVIFSAPYYPWASSVVHLRGA